jgi:hypothetical protein
VLIRELLGRPDLFNMLFIEIVEFKAAHAPDMYKAIIPHLAGLEKTVRSKTGRFRDIPDPVILRSFVGLFFSYYITGILLKNLPGADTDQKSLDQFVDLFLYGVLADSDPLRVNNHETAAGLAHP